MSVRPTKGRKIFGLYEDSFHGFKGRYFKIIPVGDHRPFWLSLEAYEGLRAEQRERVDVLTTLFSERNLKPKPLLSHPEEARREIVKMAGDDVTLNRLRHLFCPTASAGAVIPNTPAVGHAGSGPSSMARASTPPIGPTPEVVITPEQGSSNAGGRDVGSTHEVSSPVRGRISNFPFRLRISGRCRRMPRRQKGRGRRVRFVSFVPWTGHSTLVVSLRLICLFQRLRRPFGTVIP
ncbi:hypothetical protein PIB30_011285 [Stylosanthes scabra]|uniref:Uncharacterized protein n=1 Tax=Stylosanthes scabra TaxID=79078 RepID=A0ABU6V7B9_9FABA|nr:hypothetical protein [Stylosanthes scabra]